MRNKKTVLLLVLILVAMIIMTGWLAVKIGLLKNPSLAYFPDESSRLPKVHWILGQFQPVYLNTYSNKDGMGYIRAAYRDVKGKIRTIDLFTEGGEKLGYAGLMLPGKEEAVKTGRYLLKPTGWV